MKFSLTIGLLGTFALAACENEPPPQHQSHPPAKYPQQTQTQYPTQPQPFQEGAQPTPPPSSEPSSAAQETSSQPAPNTAPKAKGDYPYGVPVPGKPGFVRSPYSPDKMTDVRGYAPGTEVKDPYTQKIFLVP